VRERREEREKRQERRQKTENKERRGGGIGGNQEFWTFEELHEQNRTTDADPTKNYCLKIGDFLREVERM